MLAEIQRLQPLAQRYGLDIMRLGAKYEPSNSAVKRQQNLEETQVKNVIEQINLTLLINTMTAKTVLTMVRITPEYEPGSG